MHDFIIVGAGSAGCVLADRLSQDPGVRVLLLEAGPSDTAAEISVPAAFFSLLKGPLDWDYATTPQGRAAGRQVVWPRGRTLGGSSSINGMVYIRGSRLDYDTWRDDYGCAGWGYADLLPYFMRAEDNQRGASAFHGAGGPLRVEDPRHVHRVCRAWLEAARTMGLEGNDDFNGTGQDGVGYYQLNQRDGRRWSAADAHLRPALRRGDLTVETDALATRVVVEGGRAVGVRYLRRGAEHEARTGGEVILCGGSINSPQLLMLSGVGPAGHLREHGIDVVVDAPGVGAGLQDHPLVLPEWRTPSIPGLMEEATPENMALWQREGRGPMASSGAEVGGFARTRHGLQAPDLQFGAAPLPSPVDLDPTQPPPRVVVTLVIAVDVASRGSLRLRSADPRSKPLIDPAYLADEADLDTLVAGVRLAREIVAHQPLAGMVAGEHAPGEQVRDDEELRDWIRRNLGTCFHPTSTCAMGGGDDAVCDPELRVRGVRGLRVVDASVMPAVPRGNTNAPTMAVAERAADLIRGDTPLAPAHLELEPAAPETA